MRQANRGFTLLELLVVMAIIGFLAAALTIASAGLKQRSKIEKTGALVRRVDAGCEAYFTHFQDYPADYAKLTAADIKSGKVWPLIHHDKYLYDYLAKPMTVVEGFQATGSKLRNLDPFVEMKDSEVKGPDTGKHTVQALDAWGGPLWYDLPGHPHGANFPDRTQKFEIVSDGPNLINDSILDQLNPVDDVTDWAYDRK